MSNTLGRRILFSAVFFWMPLLPLPAVAEGDHLYASISAVFAAALGADSAPPIASESEAASNLEVIAGLKNVYPSGGTYITALAARRTGLFPEQGSLAGGGLGSVFVPGNESRERYQIVQEFDNPSTDVERFEATLGTSYWHGSSPYRTRYVSLDYYAGSIAHFGYEGPARRFDVSTSYIQTTVGHLFEVSPTYSLPLDRRGRTNGWVSFTYDAPIGNTPERYAGFVAGATRQLSRRMNLAMAATRYWSRDDAGSYSQRYELSLGAKFKW